MMERNLVKFLHNIKEEEPLHCFKATSQFLDISKHEEKSKNISRSGWGRRYCSGILGQLSMILSYSQLLNGKLGRSPIKLAFFLFSILNTILERKWTCPCFSQHTSYLGLIMLFRIFFIISTIYIYSSFRIPFLKLFCVQKYIFGKR